VPEQQVQRRVQGLNPEPLANILTANRAFC
jgi:hypothetical protein